MEAFTELLVAWLVATLALGGAAMSKCVRAKLGEFCIWCYEGVKAKAYHRGHFGYSAEAKRRLRERQCMAMKRPAGGGHTPGTGTPSASDLEVLFPSSWSHLTEKTWEDGSAREVSTLLIFWEDNWWKCCRNDRALSRSAWSSGSTPEGLLQELEAALATDRLEWRAKSPGGKKR